MDSCECCSDQLVTDCGMVCCTGCGKVVNVAFVVSVHQYCLEPLQNTMYSRQARFRRFVNQHSRVFTPVEKIMLRDAFSILEEGWSEVQPQFTRKYFISQSVMLYWLCQCLLGIQLRSPLRSLQRVDKQLMIVNKLLQYSKRAIVSRFGSKFDLNLKTD
jgi:hypothetical protein